MTDEQFAKAQRLIAQRLALQKGRENMVEQVAKAYDIAPEKLEFPLAQLDKLLAERAAEVEAELAAL